MPKRLALLVLFGLSGPLWAESIETHYYRLGFEGDAETGKEYARLLDAAWKQFQGFFKKKPAVKKGDKLAIRYFATKEAWAEAIKTDGDEPGDSVACYLLENQTAYAFAQPTRYGSRHALLLAAAHQYHYLARTRNEHPAAAWWTLGVAEYLAAHNWDGRKLELGVLPLVSTTDHAAKAIEIVQQPSFSLESFVAGGGEGARPVGWALVRFLATANNGKPLKGFSAFAAKADGGVAPPNPFKRRIGPPAELQRRFLLWLDKEQEPWSTVLPEWEALAPDRLRGRSRVLAACRLKDKTEVLTATLLVPKKGGWKGGVLLHYESDSDYSIALIDWAGFIEVKRRKGRGWQIIERGEGVGPGKDGNYHLQAIRKKGNVYLMLGPYGYGPWELPGHTFGLVLQRAELEFRDISVK